MQENISFLNKCRIKKDVDDDDEDEVNHIWINEHMCDCRREG